MTLLGGPLHGDVRPWPASVPRGTDYPIAWIPHPDRPPTIIASAHYQLLPMCRGLGIPLARHVRSEVSG